MTNAENGGEFANLPEFGESLAIATAIAQRDMQESQATEQFVGEVIGMPSSTLSDEVQFTIKVARTAMLLRRVENPDSTISTEEVIDAVFLGGFNDLLQGLEGYGEFVSEAELVEVCKNQMKFLMEAGGQTEDEMTSRFAAFYGAAQRVAEENNVGVAEVYADDDLYAAAHREAYTPEEFIDVFGRMHDAVSEESLDRMILQLVDDLIPADMKGLLGEDAIQEIVLAMQLDPEFQKELRDNSEKLHVAVRAVTRSYIVRFWGSEVMESLPDQYKAKIGYSDTVSVEVGGMTVTDVSVEEADMLVMREAFVKTYFEEQGWDTSNPSIEQILEVRSQPGWQNPLG